MKAKKIFLISLILLVFLPLLFFAVALPFKQTRYLLLRINNKKKGLEAKIKNYGNFVKKYPSYIPPKLKLAAYYQWESAKLRAEQKSLEADRYMGFSIGQYNAVLKIDPENEEALSALGRIYIRKKELDKATGIFRALVELEPDDAAARQILASIYYSRDMADEALDEINKAIAIDPKNGDLYLAKAAIHEKTDDLPETLLAYKEAVEVFQEGKKTLPEKVSEAVARYQLGRFYLRTGLLFDALQEFKKTLELWPDSPDAHIELARTYYFLGLNDRAISVILDSPLNPILWGPLPYEDDRISKKDKMDICDILGRAFLRKEDYINSLKYFNMARTLGAKYNPSLVDYIHELAKISWKDVKERYKAGDQVEGTVKTVTNYGVIIELEENVDGLVSVSDVSWTKRVKHPGDIFKEGKKTEAVVLDVDEEKSKITLGIKQLSLDPWNEMKERYAPGTVHSGRITEITDLGVYVELEKELEGFLHRSKMKLEPSKSLKDSYRIGDALEVEVINIDDIKRRITLEQK